MVEYYSIYRVSLSPKNAPDQVDTMSAARSDSETMTASVDPLPPALESNDSKLVYLYLDTTEEATVTELQSALGMKQLALLPVLGTLREADLITRTGDTVSLAA